jgi:hypothetical protein
MALRLMSAAAQATAPLEALWLSLQAGWLAAS